MFQNNRCALSGSPLELPAVHFLCGHSFNARSLGENERECPLCAPQFRTILEIRRSLRAGASEQVCLILKGMPLGLCHFAKQILPGVACRDCRGGVSRRESSASHNTLFCSGRPVCFRCGPNA